MSNQSISQANNKNICNAFGCSSNATQKISVSAGTFGTISLNLCNNCIGLFKEKGEKLIG
jgi:hypothetical protein